MEDEDAKLPAVRSRSELPVKPGAVAMGGGEVTALGQSELVGGSTQSTSKSQATKDTPHGISQLEQDIIAKQQGRNAFTAGATTQDSNVSELSGSLATTNPPRPGSVTSEAPDSRLVAKLRGELPQDWNTSVSVNAVLRDREDQIQEKIRTCETLSSSTPGALAALTSLQDSIVSKQGAGGGPIHASEQTPVELRQREEIVAAKSSQVSFNVGGTPQRLREAETMVDLKMRESLDDFHVNNLSGAKRDEGGAAGNKDSHALEYGEFGGPSETGLAVAVAVEEDERDVYLPSAVEYDPDAKPPVYRNRRFRMYAYLALITVIVVTVGAVLGITLTNEGSPEIPIRATVGIRENVALFVGSNEPFDDVSNPYRKALDWIMFDDPMAVTPDHPNLNQRFLAAYFYFATSVKTPWDGDCAPAVDEKDACKYEYVISLVPKITDTIHGFRWLSGVDECSWVGVNCDESLQIRGIDLSGINMTGTFPEGIVKFPYFQSITLAHSELEGPLPDYLANMRHLVYIALNNNAFTGSIPDGWLKSRSLQSIVVSGNNLTGTLTDNIAELKDLKRLTLDENDLGGSIPTEIGDLSNLVEFTAGQNGINGTIPTEVGNLQYLWTLHLFRNQITGTLPSEIGLLEVFSDFRVQVNLLTGTIPEQFWDATTIWRIDLFENQFNGTISGKIGKLTDLSRLFINDNQFSGNLTARLGSLGSLYTVVASGNNFTGTVPPQICDLSERGQLETLELDCAVPLGGGVPEVFCPTDCCTLCCDSNGATCNPA